MRQVDDILWYHVISLRRLNGADVTIPSLSRTRVNLPPAASGLNFIRGGQSGFEGYTPSGFSKATWDDELLSYRQAIATIVDQMARDTSLMGDNRRVDIDCDHI